MTRARVFGVFRAFAAFAIGGLVILSTAVALYFLTPTANTDATAFDALIVLGCPSMPDGSPTPEQLERTLEGVREFKRGAARRVIMSGSAAHSRFVEAHQMAELAILNGVPASALIEENQSRNTIENIFYSDRIVERMGWRTVEVISSPSHLARAAVILAHYRHLEWRTHPAPWPKQYSGMWKLRLYSAEIGASTILRIPGLWRSAYLP